MKKNVDIKFRLRFRRIKDSATGESVMGSKKRAHNNESSVWFIENGVHHGLPYR